jgi:hypothetical protein
VKSKIAALIVAALFPLCAFAITGAVALTSADNAWIGKCMDQLKLENPDKKIVRKYCVCMHGFFEDNRDVDQSEMESTFPPAHRYCNRQAGWKEGTGRLPVPRHAR